MLPQPKLDEDRLAEQAPLSDASHLHIEMGYQCNYRCTFCYQVDFSAQQNMDEVIWRERLRGLYPTLKSAFLQGGEPTIMKNCIGLRDLLVEEHPHVKLGIVTNGLRLDQAWTDVMLRQGYLLQVSLNGATKAVYDRTMRFGKYDQVMANIGNLLERRRNEGSPVEVHLSYVIVPENVCELADFVAMAARMEIDEIKFFTDQHLSAASDDVQGTLREIDRAYEAIAAHPQVRVTGLESFELLYRKRHSLMDDAGEAAKRCACSRAQDLCQIPWTQIYVKHKGEMTFCCMTWRNCGNLHEQTVEEIWNGKKARHFRRMMLRDNFMFCSPTCLSNRNPDFSPKWTARKFAYQVLEDPDLVWKKAKNKIGRIREYRKTARSVDAEFPSVQKQKSGRKA